MEANLTINIISVGKIKEQALQSLVFEYSKRITKFCKINHIEIKDLSSEHAASDKEKQAVIDEEGRLILEKVNDREFIVALAIEGDTYSSEKFATFLDKSMTQGGSRMCFVIGGSLGLSDAVKKRANSLMSFSNLTFPHQLMRLILVEQIYRAFKILNNEPYHK